MKIKDCIFVFGSNGQGIHGKGAALTAKNLFGAIQGQGSGHYGMSYAVQTKSDPYHRIPLSFISAHVRMFLSYARVKSDYTFLVTRLGTGLAGYNDYEISPMFQHSPSNCILPSVWNINNGNISHNIESISNSDLYKEVY